MIKNNFIIFLFVLIGGFANQSWAQDSSSLQFHLKDAADNNIIGAAVSFPESNRNTISDANGIIEVVIVNKVQAMKIQHYSGIDTTIIIDPKEKHTDIILPINGKSINLDNVTIVKRRKSSEISMLSTTNTTRIGIKELAKAACCNISESFETTPSVDVGFTDAVTGYRQISMLGLAGSNVSFTRENIPDLRGLGAVTGLTFTPGPWLEGIMLSKGTGSVLNGYEGVAGQINIELSKPDDNLGFRYYINAYQSTQGRSEANLVKHDIINEQTDNSFFLHYKNNWMRVDQNKDSYLDQPMGQTISLANKFLHISNKNIEYQLGIKGVYMNLFGGENKYKKNQEVAINKPWGFDTDIYRGEVWAKIGKLYLNQDYRSQAVQLSGVYQDQKSKYGLLGYNGLQQSFYLNYIYQDIIINTNHKYKVGASFVYDDIREKWQQYDIERREIVPGVYGEYTYNYLDKFNLVAGVRGDYNNYYGFFITPRLHLRYAPDHYTTLRASIGRAQRTVNIFSENAGFMASSRSFEILPTTDYENSPYGLAPEVSWNMGGNIVRKFVINNRDLDLQADYYFTKFSEMVVRDIESFDKVLFYNLNGKSFAHSFQTQVDYELFNRMDIRFAYRWYDVKTTYGGELKSNPLIARNRFFVNVAYETRKKWKADFTAAWTDAKRMVDAQHTSLPVLTEGYMTPSYWTLNAQVSKSNKKDNFRVYLGAENILNDMQHHLIMNPTQPYQSGFDAGLVWGNAMGRNIYLGIDFKIK